MMVEETWDELWKNMPIVVYGLRGGKSTHVEWLDKVKAEGDKLKESLREALSQSRVNGQHRMLYQSQRDEAREKLEAVKRHLTEYPDVDGRICEDCPYPTSRKTREGACGNCAVGTVKFWLQDHKKILEGS